jgi:hypothetical protein
MFASRPRVVALFTFVVLTAPPLAASKLVEVRPVDEQVLMVYFKDGEVLYRDDGTGPSAYDGHAYVPGDDELVAYGEELDTGVASNTGSWHLVSDSGLRYGPEGRRPVAVHRNAKVTNADHDWSFKLDHWIFLRLPEPLEPGADYTLRVDPATGSDRESVAFTFELDSSLSEAIHVNLLGYTPDSPVKAADLYLWLGDGGPRDYSAFEGRPTWLYDVDSGERHRVGEVTFWKKSAPEAEGRNLTGSDVWNVDFSGFDRSGTYRLVVDGVGCSRNFEIRDDVWRLPFQTSLRGYYYIRVGEDPEGVKPVPRQPRFLPGKDPEGFTVYLTDLDPFDPEWEEHPGDTWDEPHFKPAVESMFWRRRLPGNPTNPNAFGGHSDALDWDRHLAHVSNIYDLLLPYLVTAGLLDEDDLQIAESGNGLPDLIDEARNEVDLFLRLRVGEAYAQGLTNPSEERTAMFQAGATTMAAWANAANAAMLAEALRIAGRPALMARYRDEATEAFRFAERQEDRQLDDHQGIGAAVMRGRDFRMMAAAFLYNLTGERAWEDILAEESVVREGPAEIESDGRWVQTWGTAAYLFTPREQHYPELAARMREAIRRQALENNVRHMDERPSRRSSNRNYWRTAHNLQLVSLAHALSDDSPERKRLEKAMVLEADWGLGRNPSNIVEMTGLGSRHIVNCYTSGRNDGSPGLHPGHTPYNNLDPWGGTHNGSNPRWFTERGYPDWDEGGWPEQESHFNNRYSWANAEFTPRETMRGKMVLYAYLHAMTKGRPASSSERSEP